MWSIILMCYLYQLLANHIESFICINDCVSCEKKIYNKTNYHILQLGLDFLLFKGKSLTRSYKNIREESVIQQINKH